MDAEYDDNEITVVKEIPIPPPSPPRDQFGRVRREGVDLGPTAVSQASHSSYGASNSKPYPGESAGSWQQQQPSNPAASVPTGGWQQQQQSSGWQQQGSVAMGGWQQQPSAVPAVGPKFPQNPILGPARSEGWVGERQRYLKTKLCDPASITSTVPHS